MTLAFCGTNSNRKRFCTWRRLIFLGQFQRNCSRVLRTGKRAVSKTGLLSLTIELTPEDDAAVCGKPNRSARVRNANVEKLEREGGGSRGLGRFWDADSWPRARSIHGLAHALGHSTKSGKRKAELKFLASATLPAAQLSFVMGFRADYGQASSSAV